MLEEDPELTAATDFYAPGPAFDDCQAEVLLYSFYGGMDSGDIGAMTVFQLLRALPSKRVVDFNLDPIFDYRSRRPRVEVNNWVMGELHFPECSLECLTDYAGKRFLLLHGMEPDLNWGQFAQIISEVLRKTGIKEAVDLQGIASAVPHTRPPIVNHISPQAEALPTKPAAPGNFLLPLSFGQMLQICLAAQDIKSHGLLVTVPYYMSEGQYPPAAVAALEYLSQSLDLDLPLGDLEASATVMEQVLTQQISDTPEAAQLVKELEEQYDQAPPGAWENFVPKSLAEAVNQGEPVNLAERVEAFLARLEDENSIKADPLTQPTRWLRLKDGPVDLSEAARELKRELETERPQGGESPQPGGDYAPGFSSSPRWETGSEQPKPKSKTYSEEHSPTWPPAAQTDQQVEDHDSGRQAGAAPGSVGKSGKHYPPRRTRRTRMGDQVARGGETQPNEGEGQINSGEGSAPKRYPPRRGQNPAAGGEHL